ncbi:MAG: family 10 glycosylhydrolase [Bacteroidetes bacterium]|nr:family 10 glycosylhydrolase [Bacteroidota bacterium]
MKRILAIGLILILTINFYSQQYKGKYEFRGAWVATVANIDWPSRNNITSGNQVKELVVLFDSLKSAGINAVLFQIRTECDAFYESEIEPWSYYLTERQGIAPEPFFDPLEFAIKEAHNHGMELHAWFNPYRASRDIENFKLAETHVVKSHPDWILEFGKYRMLDPGLPAVREHVLKVMSDVLTRYDIDGIHFDDYFYPYTPKVSNEDSLTFARFNRGFTDIDDWRRDNINLLMAQINAVIKAVKPHVKFGISPFGIVRNEYSGTDGFNSFDILYCDPMNWIDNKILDYMNPQIYWEIGHSKADYAKLLHWWAEITKDMHLYIGQYSSRMMAQRYENKGEIGAQINLNRATENVHGSVFFSAKSIGFNWSGMADSMKQSWYKYPALTPPMPWKDSIKPNVPRNLEIEADSLSIIVNWEEPDFAEDGEYASKYIVYKFNVGEKINLDDASKILAIVHSATIYLDDLPSEGSCEFRYVVTALDKLNNESASYAEKVFSME